MKQFFTFDIGGTDIKYGVVTENGQLIQTYHMPTEAYNGGPSIINRVIETIQELQKTYTVDGVAISTAGVIDPYKGEVIYATDAIPNYIGVQIKKLIEENTGLITEVQNDVNCFALCEANLGVAKSTSNFITLTVGTGIGGAIYINNEMYYGKGFSAGEWGRMRVLDKKFEEVASITGLIGLANQYIKEDNWNGKKIFDLYDQGDSKTMQVVHTFYNYLATGIMNLIYIFNPEKVVIGGGITSRGQQFIDELTHHLKEIKEPKFLEQTSIEIAKFSNHSGMIGALFHFLDMQNKRLK